jgi:hypothetical protein
MNDKSLTDEVSQLLEETRVVVPGTQAMLAFQLVVVFSEAFTTISLQYKYLHVISLLCTTSALFILMSSAAYHRIAEKGEDTRRMCAYARRAILSGMFLLAVGVAFDMWLVTMISTGSQGVATFVAVFLLGLAMVLWYLWPYAQRR